MLFHAGAGQRSSLDEIRRLYLERHPEARIDFSYKGSGYFLADLQRSREGDLYLPGEEFYLLQAQERGLVASYDPEKDIAAYFVTVMLTRRGNPQGIRTLEDLARPGIRLGLGNPRSCAIGIWHERTFRRAGLWEAVQANAVMSAKCIPELGNAVQHGAIDATIVWSPTAVLYLRDTEVVPLPPRYRGGVRLPVAVLSCASQPEQAESLKAFVLSAEGKAAFRRHAYAVEVGPTDHEGFLLGPGPSDRLMQQLVAAARAVKDPSIPLAEAGVGPLQGEVIRQRVSK